MDRDERPDVDSRYQSAVSAISGQGGWPLTGFLTPDGRPFFGGTYFPPEDAMGRPGFPRILQAVADAYANKREELERAAVALVDAVTKAESFSGAQGTFDPGIIEHMIEATLEMFRSEIRRLRPRAEISSLAGGGFAARAASSTRAKSACCTSPSARS